MCHPNDIEISSSSITALPTIESQVIKSNLNEKGIKIIGLQRHENKLIKKTETNHLNSRPQNWLSNVHFTRGIWFLGAVT